MAGCPSYDGVLVRSSACRPFARRCRSLAVVLRRLEPEKIYGEAKLRALRNYANGRFPSWRLEYAFGNDCADRFVLSAAANAVAVCPSARLRALAETEGWTRAIWR